MEKNKSNIFVAHVLFPSISGHFWNAIIMLHQEVLRGKDFSVNVVLSQSGNILWTRRRAGSGTLMKRTPVCWRRTVGAEK
ncbi:MAG: hypothetical protein KQH63_02290 [Desulfobulbaceae bacterium]|nr:hypothetical protein [Desulfobulbaceae bacterium]